jgi:hypothetical protein
MKPFLKQCLKHLHNVAIRNVARGLCSYVIALGFDPCWPRYPIVGQVESAADDSQQRGVLRVERAVRRGEIPAALASGQEILPHAGRFESQIGGRSRLSGKNAMRRADDE